MSPLSKLARNMMVMKLGKNQVAFELPYLFHADSSKVLKVETEVNIFTSMATGEIPTTASSNNTLFYACTGHAFVTTQRRHYQPALDYQLQF